MIESPSAWIGLLLIAAAVVWFLFDSRKSSARDVHGQINDLIKQVKSENAKSALRQAGKALYDENVE